MDMNMDERGCTRECIPVMFFLNVAIAMVYEAMDALGNG